MPYRTQYQYKGKSFFKQGRRLFEKLHSRMERENKKMKETLYYMAPMEGVTDYIYRNAFHMFFESPDKYFTPFISTNQKGTYKPRDLCGILPENNRGLTVVPQLLTNQADQFLRTVENLEQYGYGEFNLNLGCPSGTVVAKYKGSGFLAKRQELDLFLDRIFAGSKVKISVKTRLGRDCAEEFYELIKIFDAYPLEELIIHPRIQKEYYKNKPNLKVFLDALNLSRHSICYNGDVFTEKDCSQLKSEFPQVKKVMLGRGLIINPGLIHVINGGEMPDQQRIKAFHDKMYGDYRAVLFGDKNVLFRMKELWSYLIYLFPDSEKYGKRIKKAESLIEYEEVVARLLQEKSIMENVGKIKSWQEA